LEKKIRKIELQQIDGEEIRVESNYLRELLYNLGTVSIIKPDKVAVLQNPTILLSENFGGPFNN
jgi:hypothetical protein